MLMANDYGNLPAVLSAARRAMRYLVPAPDILPSVWAEQNVRIPIGNAKPGPIRFDNAPYQRGMLDVIKEPGIRRVSYMTGAQLGKTTIQQCITGYFIAHEPRSQIFVQPTQGDVQTFLETKLRPMLEANPDISRRMAKQRGREGVNNSRIISYIGGWIMFAWAGSPKTLRGRSAPVVQADEIDGMEATPEGDPGELLAQRAATFGDDALRTESSTPTVKGASRIEVSFDEGDGRRYFVACPHCGHDQHFKWEGVSWSGRVSRTLAEAELDKAQEHEPETAVYVCEGCGAAWSDGERIAAIRAAEGLGLGWRAERAFRGHASFHAPEMLSTFRRLRDIVQSYLDKLALDDVRSFANVSLAETFEDLGEQADASDLEQRAEMYPADVPAGAVYLTAGVDMQHDRLEISVVGWGLGEESWSIAHQVLYGDPLQSEVWQDLDDYLERTWAHESGLRLRVEAACLDTGGEKGYTQAAYEYLRGRTGRRLFGVKGVGGWGRPIVEKSQRKQSGKSVRKVDLFRVGVDEAKLILMRRLGITEPGPGYSHTPDTYSTEWYKQLTAEKLLVRYQHGSPVRKWVKPDKARNEALDCYVYAFAALKIMVPNLKRIAERLAAAAKEETDRPMPEEPSRASDPKNLQVDLSKEAPQNDRVFKSKRAPKLKKSGRNWATQW